MKKNLFTPLFLIRAIAWSFLGHPKLAAQERIKEFVQVVNVEIVARVTLTIRAISEMGELWTSQRELELSDRKPEASL